ncbi:MAG: hypothetical protein A2W23_07450 [Planctomycetes bacterium RBG_16_43_13]|nr:MAG: hypothetical protein A2W23_07450 [Planctomycetes bacterium RBG_16_43_13]
MERIVRYLASDDMKGRGFGTEEGRTAARFVAGQFEKFGLKPGGESNTYFQKFGNGFNVLGVLEGRKHPDTHIVISAHHDHLGEKDGRIYNGADDNASGVAMLLELAEAFSKASKPNYSILFISFEAEELGKGMAGSRYFVRSGLYDTKKFRAMICFDLVGGNLFEWEDRKVYAFGSEHCERLSKKLSSHIGQARAVSDYLDVTKVGVYLIEPLGQSIARSDYAGFRDAGVPFVFFTTGTPWYYHTTEDDADKLNYRKMEMLGRFLFDFIKDISQDEGQFYFSPEIATDRIDALNIAKILDGILLHKVSLTLDKRTEKYIIEKLPLVKRMASGEVSMDKQLIQWLTARIMVIAAKSRR